MIASVKGGKKEKKKKKQNNCCVFPLLIGQLQLGANILPYFWRQCAVHTVE